MRSRRRRPAELKPFGASVARRLKLRRRRKGGPGKVPVVTEATRQWSGPSNRDVSLLARCISCEQV